MTTQQKQQAIALSAVFQAASLVEELARTGDVPGEATQPMIDSLFVQNPDNFDSIYGDPAESLGRGLETLLTVSDRDAGQVSPDVTRYALSLLHLERKLSKAPGMLDALGQGIQQASRQAEHFSNAHPNTIAALADLYKQTLSQLSFRIRVTGNPTYLQNAGTADKVRAILLSGIRAAILWRQVGGRRWQLLFSRRRYSEICRDLLTESDHS